MIGESQETTKAKYVEGGKVCTHSIFQVGVRLFQVVF